MGIKFDVYYANTIVVSYLDKFELTILVGYFSVTELLLPTVTVRLHPPCVQYSRYDDNEETSTQCMTGRLEVLEMRNSHGLIALQGRIKLSGAYKTENTL